MVDSEERDEDHFGAEAAADGYEDPGCKVRFIRSHRPVALPGNEVDSLDRLAAAACWTLVHRAI